MTHTTHLPNAPLPEPIMLSALQHFVFCPRQCALIHVERVWSENAQTMRGNLSHERAHGGGSERRGEAQTLRSLPLLSRQHGLYGVSDVVELHAGRPVPVEYKSGRRKPRLADEVQLCAQAICLEEMFAETLKGVPIECGYIYHAASHTRREVPLTAELRGEVLRAAAGVRGLLQVGYLPEPTADERCKQCSLIDECEPFAPRSFPRGFDPFSTALED